MIEESHCSSDDLVWARQRTEQDAGNPCRASPLVVMRRYAHVTSAPTRITRVNDGEDTWLTLHLRPARHSPQPNQFDRAIG